MSGRQSWGADRSAAVGARYRAALKRLIAGKPSSTQLASPHRINAKNVAIEAGLSRNPLYTTHRDILLEIRKCGAIAKPVRRRVPNGVSQLVDEIKALREEIATVRSENASLLYRLSEANKSLEHARVVHPILARRRTKS